MRRVGSAVALCAALAACGQRSDPPGRAPASVPAPPTRMDPGDAAVTERDPIADDPRRWFAGDVHMHVAPPDAGGDVMLDIRAIADKTLAAGLDFVVLTPHLWPSRWGPKFRARWRELADDAAKIAAPTMIPGVEWSDRDGHFTVTGVDIASLRGARFLDAADRAGAFISANHPFAVPTRIPGIAVSHFDISYRVWSDRRRGFTNIDGAEVWNVPLAWANLVSKPGGKTGEERAWLELDRVAREERRRVTAVGGTDNHKATILATTWVLAVDATAASILRALADGATCIGGIEAGTFRARGDAGAWVRIGESLATQTIRLAWDGTARLFIDGVDRGEHTGGFVHDTGGAPHTYRIAIGPSRCGFIYANLDA